jgi:PTS system ascorbate-specific IIB component
MARRMRIVTVCGCGLGSSLLAKGTIEKIAREFGVQTIIDAADAGTAKGYEADLIAVQSHLQERLGEIPGVPIVSVKSFVDPDELRTLLGPHFKEFLEKGS